MPTLPAAIPEPALKLYERSEEFRQQISMLELLVEIYNNICTSVLPVEKDLMLQQLQDVDACLREGVEVSKRRQRAGQPFLLDCYLAQQFLPDCIQALNWNSSNLGAFLEYSMQQVKDLNLLLCCIKDAVKKSEAIFHQFEQTVMFDRKEGRAISFQDLSNTIQDHISRRHVAISGKKEWLS